MQDMVGREVPRRFAFSRVFSKLASMEPSRPGPYPPDPRPRPDRRRRRSSISPAKLPFRLGRLPGDIVHRGEHSTFYFPITTSIVVSVALSFLLWLISQFRR